MLRVLKELDRYAVSASDGEIGTVADVLFDDEQWTVRYLVAETGGFFSGRPVLISPIAFRQVDWATRQFHVALTKQAVKNCPGVDVHKPVSRQHESELFTYYGYANYWGSTGLWGASADPSVLGAQQRSAAIPGQLEGATDAHLRSTNEIRGYQVLGSDDVLGHIDDFIVDDKNWQVRYLVIATGDQWFGKKVLIAPQWTTGITWPDRVAHVNISRQGIQGCPAWDPKAPINLEYESRLYDYFGHPVQWVTAEPLPEVAPASLARTLPG